MARRTLSRRTVVQAAASTISLPELAAALPRLPGAIRQLSVEWLALKQQEDHLTARRSTLEAWLVKHFAWAELSEDEQDQLVEGRELRQIESQLDQVEEQRRGCRGRLLDLPSATLGDALAKFRIILDMVEPADQPTLHRFLSLATDELEALLAQRALH